MNTPKCPNCGNDFTVHYPEEQCPHCGGNGTLRRDPVQIAATKLAEQLYRFQPEITEIRSFCSGAAYEGAEPIRLLEVNATIPASGMAMPLGFKPMPASGIPFPSEIISVTPEEYEKITTGQMILPPGWRLEASKPVARPGGERGHC